MQISLIQLDGEDILWSPEHMPMLLRQTPESDLIVFPEGMPFLNDKDPILHKEAMKTLSDAGKQVSECTFIAGGYISEAEHTRNRVYLVNRGKVIDWYDKQIVWEGEDFKPGIGAKCFEWDGKKCIPLICADAGEYLSPEKIERMFKVIKAGAGPKTPIVISSYGGGLLTDYWQPSLREWSKGCDAPVLICGISGTHSETFFKDTNKMSHPFGGGGSGAFWPTGHEQQSGRRGIVTVNIASETAKWKAIRGN